MRPATPDDAGRIAARQLDDQAKWLLQLGDEIVGTIKRLPGRKLVVIDACRAAGGTAAERRPVPVILLTAKAEVADRVEGLDLGLDGDLASRTKQLTGVLTRAVGDAAQHALLVDDGVVDGRDGRRVDPAQGHHAALVAGAQSVEGKLAGGGEDDGGVESRPGGRRGGGV